MGEFIPVVEDLTLFEMNFLQKIDDTILRMFARA